MSHLLAFAAFGLATGLGDRELRVFERAAAKEIKSHLQGELAQVKVTAVPDGLGVLWGALERATICASDFNVDSIPFYVEPTRSKAGRCGHLTLDLKDFTLRNLRVASLYAEIPACRYDRTLVLTKKQFRLSKSGIGKGTVKVREKCRRQ